jgi:3-dehydroquinate synthase
MEKVVIDTPSNRYPVFIGNQSLHKMQEFMQKNFSHVTKVWVIADESVYSLHGKALVELLKTTWEVTVFIAPAGEEAKSFTVYEEAITHGLENGVDRKSLVIAFGGGATGDLAGFVASSFMRGIPFIGVPTTILAHDSSVGGKVAINHRLGKNMVGHFYQPEAVFFELDFLKTLPQDQVLSGLAEVIKHALIADGDFLELLYKNLVNLSSLTDEFLSYCLQRGVEIKGEVVSKDEKEAGIRAFLNFGHTYGHAVESASGYGNRTHGESVMVGMVYALFLSNKLKRLNFPLENFIQWIKELGYNLNVSDELSFDLLYKLMTRDKKAKAGTPQFVLLDKIGQPLLENIDKEILIEADQYIRSI